MPKILDTQSGASTIIPPNIPSSEAETRSAIGDSRLTEIDKELREATVSGIGSGQATLELTRRKIAYIHEMWPETATSREGNDYRSDSPDTGSTQ